METTFYEKSGIVIAYTDDGETIYLFTGEPVAYIYDDSVYSFTGRHIGWFTEGWITDDIGRYVLFTENSMGGPARPARSARPAKGAKRAKPAKAARSAKPARPAKIPAWSGHSGIDFFR